MLFPRPLQKSKKKREEEKEIRVGGKSQTGSHEKPTTSLLWFIVRMAFVEYPWTASERDRTGSLYSVVKGWSFNWIGRRGF